MFDYSKLICIVFQIHCSIKAATRHRVFSTFKYPGCKKWAAVHVGTENDGT